MKKVSSLLSAVFLVGALYAQNDTLPIKPNNQPLMPNNQPLMKDTTPGLRTDTTPTWRRDTLNWNKDSLKGRWNDSLNIENLNPNDSMTRNGNWNAGDSSNLNNPDLNKIDSSNLNPATTQLQPGNLNPDDSSNSGNLKDSTSSMDNKYGDKKMKDETDASSKTTKTTKTKKVVTDRVMMKDGEMLIIKKGVETKLENSITLPDGNVITADGMVKMPDGSSVKLKDGEYIKITPKKITKTTTKTTKKSRTK